MNYGSLRQYAAASMINEATFQDFAATLRRKAAPLQDIDAKPEDLPLFQAANAASYREYAAEFRINEIEFSCIAAMSRHAAAINRNIAAFP